MITWRFYPDVAWPVPGSNTITDTFGSTAGRTTPHNGLDIGTWSSGAYSWKYEIQAVKAGYVTAAGYESSMGYYARIDHGTYNGRKIEARYLHMESSPLVSTGTSVSKSQRIGWMGSTGNSTGKHLHIDFRDANDYYDPLTFLAAPHQKEVVDYWEKNPSLKQ
ncbi:M23 family metallopeptidase [Effusibacillus consociatus]|uniref:M23 family metallopeptidase n=2 Tax=Effusibacillus consociatus TaxID=1117041 RepID=A0ABV9Q524_9BACL